MNKAIFGNGTSRNPKWYYDFYIHPTAWALLFNIVIRWDDIYSISFLCFTLHFSKNEFYVEAK